MASSQTSTSLSASEIASRINYALTVISSIRAQINLLAIVANFFAQAHFCFVLPLRLSFKACCETMVCQYENILGLDTRLPL